MNTDHLTGLLTQENIMLHKILLISIVGASFGFGPMGSKMMMKYAQKAMMQECMGPEVCVTMMKDFMAACQKCDQQEKNTTDFQDIINDIKRNAVPWDYHPNSGPNFDAPAHFFRDHVIGGRMKRQALSSSQTVIMIKEKMTDIVGKATCVLKEMGYINEDKTVNYNIAKEWITNLNVEETLKDELLYAHNYCKDFSMCMPIEKSRNPIMKELGRSITYYGCWKMKSTMSCMKQDFSKMALEMGMDNIESVMDMDIGKMWMGAKDGEPSSMNAIEWIMDGEMMMF